MLLRFCFSSRSLPPPPPSPPPLKGTKHRTETGERKRKRGTLFSPKSGSDKGRERGEEEEEEENLLGAVGQC